MNSGFDAVGISFRGSMMFHSLYNALRQRKRAVRRVMARFMPAPGEVGRIYRTTNGIYAIPAKDMVIAGVLRRGESWGEEELVRMAQILPSNASVLFVGGHVGTLAIPTAHRVHDVTAIEANPETFRFLSANVHLNAVDNITLIQTAAGEAAGSIEFIVSRDNTGGSKRKPKIADPRYFYDQPDIISVDMVRLDDVLEPRYDAIVMDIEGSEYFAMKGMPRLLAAAKTLFVEFLPHHLDNVAEVSVEQFHEAIGVAFDHMFVPSQNEAVSGDRVLPKLKEIYAAGVGEDSLIFSKRALGDIR